MFNRIAAAAIALALAACTPPAPQQSAAPTASPSASATPAPTVDRVEATYMSWGSRTENWSIRRGGEGKRLTYKSPVSTEVISENSFAVSAEAFDAIVASLKPAEIYDGDDSACKLVMTDGPYGEVVWFKGETKIARFGWMLGYDCPRKQPALDAERAGHDAVLALMKPKP